MEQKMMHQIDEYLNIKTATREEQQNQTTTTNINYIKKVMSVLKNKT